MEPIGIQHCTAFEGHRCLASGPLPEVARKVKTLLDQKKIASPFIFDDRTSRPVEVDFRGSVEEVLARLQLAQSANSHAPSVHEEDPKTSRGPGRPRLGVVSREVTLLPRHWEWLSSQPGGASVALRKLVEDARRLNRNADQVRTAQEVTFRFMTAIAGDLPGFEEATRALFVNDKNRFEQLLAPWPEDLRNHITKLAAKAFSTQTDQYPSAR